MHVVPFTDQLDLAAPLFGLSPTELAERDARRPRPVRRWLALAGERAVGTATAGERPDRRVFLGFAVDDPAACTRWSTTPTPRPGRRWAKPGSSSR